MKRKIVYLLISSVLFIWHPMTSIAGELEAVITSSTKQSAQYDHGTGTWLGLQINYIFDNNIYLFGSQENIDVLLIGVKSWEYDIKGFGIGSKYNIGKRFVFFNQIGAYRVKNSWGNYQRREVNEGIHYLLNEEFNSTGSTQSFDAYSVDSSEYVVGITLGGGFTYPLTKKLSASIIMSYRYMKIEEDISGYNDAWGCPHNETVCDKWQSTQVQDYSSINVGFGLRYLF